MSRSNQSGAGSNHERDFQDTHDELTQASIALNTAYDRLQDLRASLRNFHTQRNRVAGVRAQQRHSHDVATMHPEHSAIVLSDSDEETELDIEALRDTLPARLLELTARWGSQHTRLMAARHAEATASTAPASSSPTASSSEDTRHIYPPLRRRRVTQLATHSVRDGGPGAPSTTGIPSPARRSIHESHMRYLRYFANPTDSSTTLGRRVAQRAAERQAASASASELARMDSIVQSTLPLGLEPRPSLPSPSSPPSAPNTMSRMTVESRAAAHLRHSLLPNPPSGVRPTGSSRPEQRPRTARSNSLTALSNNAPAATPAVRMVPPEAPANQASSSLRHWRQFNFPGDASSRTFGFGEPPNGSYRVRRRVNIGEDQVFSISWSDLMTEGDNDRERERDRERDSDPFDLASWSVPQSPNSTRPPRQQGEPDTDDTIVRDVQPRRRRRGWARLDPDGDEISTEDEESLEQLRAARRTTLGWSWTNPNEWGSGAEGDIWSRPAADVSPRWNNESPQATDPTWSTTVLNFVHNQARRQGNGNSPTNREDEPGEATFNVPTTEESNMKGDELRADPFSKLFVSREEQGPYVNPLPVMLGKARERKKSEVWVTIDSEMDAGR